MNDAQPSPTSDGEGAHRPPAMVLVIPAHAVSKALPMATCIAAVERGLIALETGAAHQPLRFGQVAVPTACQCCFLRRRCAACTVRCVVLQHHTPAPPHPRTCPAQSAGAADTSCPRTSSASSPPCRPFSPPMASVTAATRCEPPAPACGEGVVGVSSQAGAPVRRGPSTSNACEGGRRGWVRG